MTSIQTPIGIDTWNMERSHAPRSENICPQSPRNATPIAQYGDLVQKTLFKRYFGLHLQIKEKKGRKKEMKPKNLKKCHFKIISFKQKNHFNFILFSNIYFIYHVSCTQSLPSQYMLRFVFPFPFLVPNRMSFQVTMPMGLTKPFLVQVGQHQGSALSPSYLLLSLMNFPRASGYCTLVHVICLRHCARR